jgi:hypothetical protein
MDQLSLAGTPLEAFHICAFFNSRDEEYGVLNPFFKQAIDNGEKNLHIVDPARIGHGLVADPPVDTDQRRCAREPVLYVALRNGQGAPGSQDACGRVKRRGLIVKLAAAQACLRARMSEC